MKILAGSRLPPAMVQRAGVQLVWVRLGNCRNPKLLAVFDALWPRIQERLDDGDRIVEVW